MTGMTNGLPGFGMVAAWNRRRIERASQRSAKARVQHSFDTPGAIGKQTLAELLPAEPVILEVGSHTGGDTEEFAVMFPRGRIWAFEADQANFVGLFHRTRQYGNVQRMCGAVGDQPGVRTFFGSAGASDGSGSLLRATRHRQRHPDVTFPEERASTVPVIVLDDFAKATGIAQVDLIWIDVQGAELMVLGGATGLLRQTSYVYAEVSREPLYADGASYEALKDFMQSHGFGVVKEFLPDEWGGDGNALFGRVD